MHATLSRVDKEWDKKNDGKRWRRDGLANSSIPCWISHDVLTAAKTNEEASSGREEPC